MEEGRAPDEEEPPLPMPTDGGLSTAAAPVLPHQGSPLVADHGLHHSHHATRPGQPHAPVATRDEATIGQTLQNMALFEVPLAQDYSATEELEVLLNQQQGDLSIHDKRD